MINLFVDKTLYPDDIKNVPLGNCFWSIARDLNDFKWYVDNHGSEIKKVSFGYKLANEESNTGYNCAVYLIEMCKKNGWKFPNYHIHTQNLLGYQHIQGVINNYLKSLNN